MVPFRNPGIHRLSLFSFDNHRTIDMLHQQWIRCKKPPEVASSGDSNSHGFPHLPLTPGVSAPAITLHPWVMRGRPNERTQREKWGLRRPPNCRDTDVGARLAHDTLRRRSPAVLNGARLAADGLLNIAEKKGAQHASDTELCKEYCARSR